MSTMRCGCAFFFPKCRPWRRSSSPVPSLVAAGYGVNLDRNADSFSTRIDRCFEIQDVFMSKYPRILFHEPQIQRLSGTSSSPLDIVAFLSLNTPLFSGRLYGSKHLGFASPMTIGYTSSLLYSVEKGDQSQRMPGSVRVSPRQSAADFMERMRSAKPAGQPATGGMASGLIASPSRFVVKGCLPGPSPEQLGMI